MADSCIALFCGLPGVGKSTFATKLFETLSNHSCAGDVNIAENTQVGTKGDGQMHNGVIGLLADCHVLRICFDDIIPDNLYRENGPTIGYSSSDEKLWKTYRSNIAEFIDEFLNKHSSSSDVFLEIEKSKILKELEYIYSKIEEKNFCRCYESALINQSKAKLLKQNSERAIVVPLETIEHMISVFEPPDPQRNGWESNVVEFDSTNGDMNSILYKALSMISYSMQNPVPSLEVEDKLSKDEARKINMQSILHQSDQVLRKYISSKMKEYQGLQMSKQYLKKQSSTLNSKRKAFLDVLKRSSRTLMHLDCLLLDWCDVKSSQFATEDSDVPFLHNDTCSIPAPELRNRSCTAIEDSQYFCNRDRFGTVVSHLFGNFNTRQTSLDGNYVLHTGVESHGITDTSQEE